jgi:hypothetical protein
VWATLNPGLGYVQGLNELLAPLYYTFSSSSAWMSTAEPDSFFCVIELIKPFRDNFCKAADHSDMGISEIKQ